MHRPTHAVGYSTWHVELKAVSGLHSKLGRQDLIDNHSVQQHPTWVFVDKKNSTYFMHFMLQPKSKKRKAPATELEKLSELELSGLVDMNEQEAV